MEVKKINPSLRYWPTSILSPILKERDKKETGEKKKAFWEKSKRSFRGKMGTYLLEKEREKKCFPIRIWNYKQDEVEAMQKALDAFTKGTNCHLRPILPDSNKNYNKGREPTNPNGQSLVLGLEYGRLEDGGKCVIFPGDAPGEICL
ncbi:MAG: hypothetical protein LBQ03_00575 [Puniceicoccales bacterium]|nr:hypothetical protein [Puniceicoccales bacterium]